jgi:hypothetical protein
MRPRERAGLASWEIASSLKEGPSLPGFSRAGAPIIVMARGYSAPSAPAYSTGVFGFDFEFDFDFLAAGLASGAFFAAGALSVASALGLFEPGMNWP